MYNNNNLIHSIDIKFTLVFSLYICPLQTNFINVIYMYSIISSVKQKILYFNYKTKKTKKYLIKYNVFSFIFTFTPINLNVKTCCIRIK